MRLLRPNVQADVDDELRFHFESRIEELLASGETPLDARQIAAAEFGDVREVKRGLVSIDHRLAAKRSRIETMRDVFGDVRYAMRSLARTKGVALAILATLGLGVGANAAMFTLLEAIYLRPPAGVVAPSGIRRVWRTVNFRNGMQYWPGNSYVQFGVIVGALGDRGTAAIYGPPVKMKLGAGESATQVQVSRANSSYFSFLGVPAELGRIYTSDEGRLDGPDPVAVLSHDYWMRAFDGKRSALGSTIVLAAKKYTVVGVAPTSFSGVDLNAADVWIPLGSQRQRRAGATPWWQDSNINGLSILVRPLPGVSERGLEQRITTALRRPEAAYGAIDSSTVARFGSIVSANGPGESSQEQRIAVRLAGVAIIVLLIACANVVNLLLSRAVRRRREIAVRLALGISRARLIRLLLVESGVLAIAAAGVAVFVAYAGGIVLRKLLLPDVHWAQSPLDGNVVLLALVVATVAGLIAGLIPALQAATPELTDALKAGAGSGVVHRSRIRTGMVVAQAALSVVLLVGALLFVRSLTNVRNVDIGFDARRLMTASVSFDDRSASRDSTLPSRIAQLADQVRAIPGVQTAGLASMAPMSGFSTITYFTETDSSALGAKWFPTVTAVSPDFFTAAGLHFLRGSNFPPHGTATPPQVIVNQTMAKGQWPGREAMGQCMRFAKRDAECYRVVGVVQDSRMSSILEDPMPQYYVPVDNVPVDGGGLNGYYVIVRADPQRVGEITAATRSLIRQEFPGGIPQVTWLSDYIEPQYRPWELGATLFTAFGVLALIVAVIGIYSTVSYGVNQRVHEFGVRIALGAQIGDVLRLVVGEGMRTLTIGIACGVVLALLAGRFVASLLYGVTPSDPVAIVSVVVALVAVGVVAALIPAWRAARVDPVSALRAD